MSKQTNYINSDLTEGVLTLTLNDPSTKNAMGLEMANELLQALSEFSKDSQSRVILITGNGSSFCSGANVHNMNSNADLIDSDTSLNADPWKQFEDSREITPKPDPNKSDEIDIVRNITRHIYQLRKPSVAAVNGPAIGFGMGLSLSCDIRIASKDAVFREAFVNVGLIPADGSCWYLPRMIGLSNTLLYQYTGDPIVADEAYRMGLVSTVTEPKKLMTTSSELCRRLSTGASYSISIIKKLVQLSSNLDYEESMDLSGIAQNIVRKTYDHKEGVRAFIEKRNPLFKGF